MTCSRQPARANVHHPWFVGLVAALVLRVATDAWAQATERITFDFTGGSSFSLLGGTIMTPPDGTMDVGTADVYVEVTAPGVYVPGGVFMLSGLNVGGTVLKNFPGQANVSGTYSASQTGPLVGTLAPGLTGGDFTSDLSLSMNTQIGCTGSGCGSLGFPVSDVGVSLFAVSFLPVADLGVPGFAQINASFEIEVDGVLGTMNLVGVEVARTFVPEPGTFVLVAGGFGILALRGRRTRTAS
jgi:hypothetical protein